MDWIMEPLAGFSSLEDPNLTPDTCTSGGVLNVCTCTGGLVKTCNCDAGLKYS